MRLKKLKFARIGTPFLREKCTICTKNVLVCIWSAGYKMNLGAFTWISTWQALDKMLMTFKSLFQPTPPSCALVDITLISLRHLKLNLSKAVHIILHSQTCCHFCIFDFAEDVTIHSDVQTRYLGIIVKFSCPTPILSVIIFFRVYHSISQGLLQRISLHTPTHTCTSKAFHFDCLYNTFSYPLALVNWSLKSQKWPGISEKRKLGKLNPWKIKKSASFPWCLLLQILILWVFLFLSHQQFKWKYATWGPFCLRWGLER